MVIVGILASRKLAQIELRDVWSALVSIPHRTTGLAILYTLASYGILTLYDGLGLRYLRESLSLRRVMFSSFLSYAFNFSLGSILGAVAMRYKLYRAWGLAYRTITKLTAFCVVTSWLGYLFVTGVALSLHPQATVDLPIPDGISVRAAGIGLLLALTFGVWFFLTRPHVRLFRRQIRSPSRPMLFSQLTVASVQWLMQPLIIYTLLQAFEPVPFTLVLVTYLMASVLAVAAHVPAGLGVIEGTFLMALEGRVPASDILAAMLAYRAIYFLAPLCVAIVLFIAFTLTHRSDTAANEEEWNQNSAKPQPAN